LGFCHLPFFSNFGRYGDFSYGIYVYAFVVQQVVADLTHTHRPLEMFVLAFPVTVILGALSWRLIEARCLKLKKAVQNSDYPLTERHLVRIRSFQA
jgi:peptidoglycan/LPS O-acetylase OafA/YrhL